MFGIAYSLGIADALAEAGVDFSGAPMIGTSAGSWTASCLATGIGFEELRQIPQMRVPNLRRGLLQGIGHELFGYSRDERVTASAVRLPTMQRRLLNGVRIRSSRRPATRR